MHFFPEQGGNFPDFQNITKSFPLLARHNKRTLDSSMIFGFNLTVEVSPHLDF